MPTLREKMKQDLSLAGLSEATQLVYLNAVIKLSEFYNKSPDIISTDELKAYLLTLKKKACS